MTFGQLFTVMNPDVKVRENSTCVWLFFDEVNHYTIAAEWWKREIPDYAVELLKEHEAEKPIVAQYAFPVQFIKKYYCSICKEEITGNNVYCHKCGRKVKWDD